MLNKQIFAAVLFVLGSLSPAFADEKLPRVDFHKICVTTQIQNDIGYVTKSNVVCDKIEMQNRANLEAWKKHLEGSGFVVVKSDVLTTAGRSSQTTTRVTISYENQNQKAY